MRTIREFIEQHGITMTAERVSARTDGATGEWDKNSFHYLVTVKCGGREHSFNFSMGAAHVEKLPYEKLSWADRAPYGMTRKDWENLPLPGVRRISLAQEQWQKAVYRPKPPELSSVLDCIASDCAGYESARHFEDWASEYGYDTDSRKAEYAYRQVGDEYRAFESLLGRAALRELMFETERE